MTKPFVSPFRSGDACWSSKFFPAVAGALAIAPFLAGLPGAFIFDDLGNIVDNQAIHMERLDAHALSEVFYNSMQSGYMRIIPMITFALDYWRGGGADPETFRVTSIVIHAITAIALAYFFHNVLVAAKVPSHRAMWAGPLLAMAWAVHPLQVSSVLYVVQRIQTLATLFVVLALLSYLQARRAQIAGLSGRQGLLITALLWSLALGCKEDAILLIAYMLALELTVLRFAAASPRVSQAWRRGYAIACFAGMAIFVLLVIPHFWNGEAYAGRNYSAEERLLTQGRVLVMYLWQIVLPLPQHMPFFYDWLPPSRGLLNPWSTLPSLALVVALLVIAWRTRTRYPLFALGIFLFFGAHAVTSNVIGLELAFEHRNHFALAGAVLALGTLVWHTTQKLRLGRTPQVAIYVTVLGILAVATTLRSNTWSNDLTFALASAKLAPASPRATFLPCVEHFEAAGGTAAGRNNPELDSAIHACQAAATAVPSTINSTALLVVLKTIRGDVSDGDWARFHERQQSVFMDYDNRRAIVILTHHALRGVDLDKQELLKALSTQSARVMLQPIENTSTGLFIMNALQEPDLAMPYFERGILAVPPNDPFSRQLSAALRKKGRDDLAERIEKLDIIRTKQAARDGASVPRERNSR